MPSFLIPAFQEAPNDRVLPDEIPFHEVQPQLSAMWQSDQLQTGGHAHPTFKLRSHSEYPRDLEEENHASG